MLADEEFDQIIDTVRHESTTSLLLLRCRISSLCSSREDFYGCCTRLMQSDTTIWPDRVFAQTGARSSGAIEHDENLASLWGDFDAEAWAAAIPVDNILCRRCQCID